MRTETFHTPGEVALRIRVPVGRIDVESVEGDETWVELKSEPDVEEEAVIAFRGGEVVVEIEERRLLFLRTTSDARVRISCPPGARIEVRAVTADVNASGTFGRSDVKTVSGDVQLDRIEGELDVKTVSGDASVEAVAGRATVQSVSGDIRVEEARSAITVQTLSGDIRLGSVTEGAVTLKTASGDMQVGVRAGSSLWVDASSLSGDTSSELALDDAPPEADGPLVEVRATTMSGDVRIVRA